MDINEAVRDPRFLQMKEHVQSKIMLAHPKMLGINRYADVLRDEFPVLETMTRTAEVHEMYAEYRHIHAGRKDYKLHDNLVTRLKHTHLSKVPAQFLRLPFNTIRLQVPNNTVFFEVVGEAPHSAREVFISEMPLSLCDASKNEVTSVSNPRDIYGIKIVLRTVPNFSYFWIWVTSDDVQECVDDSIEYMRKQFTDENKRSLLREAKEAALKTCDPSVRDEVLKEVEHNMCFTPERERLIREQFEFILKCVLYINGAEADLYWHDERSAQRAALERVRSAKKRRKLENKAHVPPHFRVGYNIVLTREEREMYANIATGKWKITSKFVVQGHFRNQVCGPKRAERKVIFIEPFYKGKDFAEEIHAKHVVK